MPGYKPLGLCLMRCCICSTSPALQRFWMATPKSTKSTGASRAVGKLRGISTLLSAEWPILHLSISFPPPPLRCPTSSPRAPGCSQQHTVQQKYSKTPRSSGHLRPCVQRTASFPKPVEAELAWVHQASPWGQRRWLGRCQLCLTSRQITPRDI